MNGLFQVLMDIFAGNMHISEDVLTHKPVPCVFDVAAVSGGLSLTDTRPLLLGEDPEARRLRTVKDIADLRQNLEETMSSLRGTQISHR